MLLADIIRSSKSTVFFGGAGVSTESGISDFRSKKNGLFSCGEVYGYLPEELLSYTFFCGKVRVVF